VGAAVSPRHHCAHLHYGDGLHLEVARRRHHARRARRRRSATQGLRVSFVRGGSRRPLDPRVPTEVKVAPLPALGRADLWIWRCGTLSKYPTATSSRFLIGKKGVLINELTRHTAAAAASTSSMRAGRARCCGASSCAVVQSKSLAQMLTSAGAALASFSCEESSARRRRR
jgi:hypothetical protein